MARSVTVTVAKIIIIIKKMHIGFLGGAEGFCVEVTHSVRSATQEGKRETRDQPPGHPKC